MRLFILGLIGASLLGAASAATVTMMQAGQVYEYWDQETAPPTGWNLPGFETETPWPTGPSPMGYGEATHATTTGIGNGITLYYRTTVFIADPAFYSWSLSGHIDDGAIVYINGVEAWRFNMPAGEISHDTLSATNVPSEANIKGPEVIPSTMFDAGHNLITVSVHQATVDSSDSTLNLLLQGTAPDENLAALVASPFFAAGQDWKYDDSGAEPANFHTLDFDDAAWANGLAPLGFGDGDEATVLTKNGNVAFFRHTFTVEDIYPYNGLSAFAVVDDGAVFYLNGVEGHRRENMPEHDDEHGGLPATFAAATKSDPEENAFFTEAVYWSGSVLREGDNVLAVRVHQATANSGDLSFDLRLNGLLAQTVPSRSPVPITTESPSPAPSPSVSAAPPSETSTVTVTPTVTPTVTQSPVSPTPTVSVTVTPTPTVSPSAIIPAGNNGALSSPGAKAGLSIGVVLGVAALGAGIAFLLWRSKGKKGGNKKKKTGGEGSASAPKALENGQWGPGGANRTAIKGKMAPQQTETATTMGSRQETDLESQPRLTSAPSSYTTINTTTTGAGDAASPPPRVHAFRAESDSRSGIESKYSSVGGDSSVSEVALVPAPPAMITSRQSSDKVVPQSHGESKSPERSPAASDSTVVRKSNKRDSNPAETTIVSPASTASTLVEPFSKPSRKSSKSSSKKDRKHRSSRRSSDSSAAEKDRSDRHRSKSRSRHSSSRHSSSSSSSAADPSASSAVAPRDELSANDSATDHAAAPRSIAAESATASSDMPTGVAEVDDVTTNVTGETTDAADAAALVDATAAAEHDAAAKSKSSDKEKRSRSRSRSKSRTGRASRPSVAGTEEPGYSTVAEVEAEIAEARRLARRERRKDKIRRQLLAKGADKIDSGNDSAAMLERITRRSRSPRGSRSRSPRIKSPSRLAGGQLVTVRDLYSTRPASPRNALGGQDADWEVPSGAQMNPMWPQYAAPWSYAPTGPAGYGPPSSPTPGSYGAPAGYPGPWGPAGGMAAPPAWAAYYRPTPVAGGAAPSGAAAPRERSSSPRASRMQRQRQKNMSWFF